jgi:hypothetical protein
VKGFNLPHYRSDHPTESDSQAWHGVGRCGAAAHQCDLGHHGSDSCLVGSLRPRGLCLL